MIKKLPLVLWLFFTLSAVHGQPLCDTSYWNHTYTNSRFKIYDSCRTITGVVKIYIPPLLTADGDYHIYIQPDSQYQWMQYYRDTAYTKFCVGDDSSEYELVCASCLNVEEICKGAIEDTGENGEIENAACANFNDTVYLPNIGEYVQATGPFVYDEIHCWNELHPISNMILLSVTNIPEPQGSSFLDGMKIFPQPASNDVEFAFGHAPHAVTLVKIYNSRGQQLYVYGMAETNVLTFDVSSWPSGDYLYSIVSQEQSKVLKNGKFSIVH